MYGRHAEAHGAVCIHHHGGNRAQAAVRHHASGHQPVLIPVLHVQSGTSALYQREYPIYVAIARGFSASSAAPFAGKLLKILNTLSKIKLLSLSYTL